MFFIFSRKSRNIRRFYFDFLKLPLCDLVWASDSAYFRTPFTQLGLTPEGCSSYLFPKIMGTSMANELLLMGAKKTAHEVLYEISVRKKEKI